MSRVIHTQPVGRDRKHLLRAIVVALRQLTAQEGVDDHSRDLVAFLVFALENVAGTVERTVGPWEKRGYWLKADRFRREWAWAGQLGDTLRQGLLAEDWGQIAQIAARLGEKVSGVHIGPRHRLGTPWQGAYARLKETSQAENQRKDR